MEAIYISKEYWRLVKPVLIEQATIYGKENIQLVFTNEYYTQGYYIEEKGTKVRKVDSVYTFEQGIKLMDNIEKDYGKE